MKKLSLLFSFLLISLASFADIAASIQKFESTYLRPLFPIAAAIIFLGGALLNLGKFFGDSRDVKQGFTNIGIYLLGLFLITGVYLGIRAISL
jgi:hypothetical protein